MGNCKLTLYATIALFILASNSAFPQPVADIFSPTFSHPTGRYNSDIQVQLASRTPNAVIYYTLNGTEPDTTSQQYTGNISIGGNGNLITLKAIAVSQDTLKSFISYAMYIIDYSYNPNGSYLTNLTWADYNNFIQGDWIGYATTPWTNFYNVKLSILPNGVYIDSTTSSGYTYLYDDYFGPVFYYGISAPSPYKTISLYNILSSGIANGFITIDFGFNTVNTHELRYIKFTDSRNLYIEMWNSGTYGPLQYYLTKNAPIIITGQNENKLENTVVYPNPATDKVVIQNLNSNVQFINQLGQVYTLEKSDVLSVSPLPRGLYVVSFQNSDGVQIRQKLILK